MKSKRQLREEALEEQRMLQKWANVPKFSRSAQRGGEAKTLVVAPLKRTNEYVPSLGTFGGVAASKAQPKYTGTAMLGVATMHKSNAVPVFSTTEATEVAKMRR